METTEPNRLSHVLNVIPKQGPKPNQKLNRPSYVYLIRCGEFIKVGVADIPLKRVKELQCYNPHPVTLVFYWRSNDAFQAERCLHIKLADKHHFGEWFKLDADEVAALTGKFPCIDVLIPRDGEVY